MLEVLEENHRLRHIASEKHFAFHGLAISLRRTGRASADVVTGRDGLSLPHEKNTRCGVLSSSLSHRSLRVFPTL